MQAIKPTSSASTFAGLRLSLGLSLVFLVLSYARIAGDALTPALGRGVMDVVLLAPIVGTKLGAELTRFVLALLLIHGLIAVAAWVMARLSLIAFPSCKTSQRGLCVFWLLLIVLWILTANAAWFPATSLGGPYARLVRTEILGFSLFSVVSIAALAAVAGVTLAAAARTLASPRGSHLPLVIGVGSLAAGVAVPTLAVLGRDDAETAAFDQPHVIVIGIDSLRRDFVQQNDPEWTPSIDAFLDDSVTFSNVLTPLARTFPAWVSIVSGKHPHTTGGFVNLLPRDRVDAGVTLPSALSAAGYQSFYAIDDVRFSNLDLSYGFDHMIAPPMGATDFLLGFFADTPLANLTVNTRAGRWLFPYSYANRAAAETYEPNTFVDWVDEKIDFEQPTLLAVHLTLTHWPYYWADSPRVPKRAGHSPDKADTTRARYEIAARAVDDQFARLLAALDRKGALDNAIVVVLSDHGESLGEAVDALEPETEVDLPLKARGLYGHGTNVFSRSQYNVVFAMHSYGNAVLSRRHGTDVSIPATLEDLTPTLLDLVDVDAGSAFDGESLAPYLAGTEDRQQPRIRFLETEFNPPGFTTAGMPGISSLINAANIYEVDPDSDRVMIRDEYVPDLLKKRQYAAELDGQILASVPSENPDEQYLIYFDPDKAQYVWLDEPPAASDDPALAALWGALEERFGAVRQRQVLPRPLGDGTG